MLKWISISRGVTMTSAKVCNKCGASKQLSEYYKNATISDGYSKTCKACKKKYQSEWRKQNRENHRKYSREYYRTHSEERSEYYKEWSGLNAAKKREYDKTWRKSNPERMRQRRKIENGRRRARLQNAEGSYTVDEWIEIKEKYGNSCLACGETEDNVKITPDHVVPLAIGGSNSIENIQPLCWSCNARKQARYIDYRVNES